MNHAKSFGQQRGIMLLEGMIAILIFSFGILAIVGLQAVTVKQTADAKYRTDASFLANQSLGLMWADRSNLAAHAVEDETLDSLPNGKRTIEVAGSQVTVTITWQMPDETITRNLTVIAQING